MLKAVWEYIAKSWLLIVSSFVFGLLLALANAAWSPKVEQNKKDKLNGLMTSLITGASHFEIVCEGLQVQVGKGRFAKTDVYKAIDVNGNDAGFCFRAEGTGFADKIELVVAVDKNFERISGYNVLASQETPGFGDRIKDDYFRSQFKGAPVSQLSLLKSGEAEKIDSDIIAISGATVTSTAVVNIFNNYLVQVKQQLIQKGLLR